jgi:hypothetical protein
MYNHETDGAAPFKTRAGDTLVNACASHRLERILDDEGGSLPFVLCVTQCIN